MHLKTLWGKPYFRFGLILLLVTLTGIFYKTSFASKPAPIATYTVNTGSIETTITIPGQITSENSVNLKFQTSGRLAWVGVKEGDRVKAFQTIAKLDQTELQKRLKKKLLAYQKERWDFENLQDEYHTNGQPAWNLPLSTEDKRLLEKAQFDLDDTVLDVEIADYTKKLASLVTPIAGIVTRVDTPVAGVNITPASAIFSIADPHSLIFEIEIDETDLQYLHEGQPTRLVLDAYPTASISGVLGTISFQPLKSGQSTTYKGKIIINQPLESSLELKLGLNGDAEFVTASQENVTIVPLKFITTDKGKSYVDKYANGQRTKTEIELGLIGDTQSEVTSGISPGDVLALP